MRSSNMMWLLILGGVGLAIWAMSRQGGPWSEQAPPTYQLQIPPAGYTA